MLGILAERADGGLHLALPSVVVGADEVDQPLEPAAKLVHEVGEVRSEIRRHPIGGPYDHAVLVVAEVGRAQPERAVLLIHVAELLQQLHHPFDRALFVQRPLAEPDVELHAEPLQRQPLVEQHPALPLDAHERGALFVGNV